MYIHFGATVLLQGCNHILAGPLFQSVGLIAKKLRIPICNDGFTYTLYSPLNVVFLSKLNASVVAEVATTHGSLHNL